VPSGYGVRTTCPLDDATVRFRHRGEEWRDRVTANRAVAYRIHHDTARGRWYVTASWQRVVTLLLPLHAALARGVVGWT
jgi:hypothetical protein